jgi:hypothetical protein
MQAEIRQKGVALLGRQGSDFGFDGGGNDDRLGGGGLGQGL